MTFHSADFKPRVATYRFGQGCRPKFLPLKFDGEIYFEKSSKMENEFSPPIVGGITIHSKNSDQKNKRKNTTPTQSDEVAQ